MVIGTKICPNCGIGFSKVSKFCSHSCAISYNNRITWQDPEIKARRIASIKRNYQENDQTLRNQHISEGEKRAFKDPIKRANKLRHIKARIGNKEFGNLMRGYIHKAINGGWKPENNAYTIARYVKDLGHIVRSKWEEEFARDLIKYQLVYFYEPVKFDLGDCFYTPDFYLPKYNCYIEINGISRPRKVYKLKKFRELYPGIELLVIGKDSKKDSLFQKFMLEKEMRMWA